MSTQHSLNILAKGTTLNLLGFLAKTAVSYGYLVLLSRMVGPYGVGSYSTAIVCVQILGVAAQLGLGKGLLRFIPTYQSEGNAERVRGSLSSALQVTLLSSVLLALSFWGVAPLLAREIFRDTNITTLLRAVAIAIPFTALVEILICFTQAHKTMRYRLYVYYTFQPIAELLLGFTFLKLGWGLPGIAMAFSASYGFALVLAIVLLIRFLPRRQGTAHTHSELRTLLGYSLPVMPSDLLQILESRLNIVVLGFFLGQESVGIYSVATQTTYLGVMLLASFNLIFAPVISDGLGRGERKEVEALYLLSAKWLLASGLPILLCLVTFSRPVLALFDPAFAQGYLVLIVLCMSALGDLTFAVAGNVLLMSGRSKLHLGDSVLSSAVMFGLDLLLIPLWGLMGAAAARAISATLVNSIKALQVHWLVQIRVWSPYYARVFSFGTLAFGLTWVLSRYAPVISEWHSIVLYASVGLLVYLYLLTRWGLDAAEQRVLASAMRRIKTICSPLRQ